MLDAFIARLQGIRTMSAGLEARLRELEIVSRPKGSLLLREGQREDYAWVILQGLVRSYYIKDDEEISSRFNQENQIVISVVSFYSRVAGYEFVETLEDCTLARIHYDELQEIYREFPEFNHHARILTEYYFTLSEQRLYLLRKQKADSRYRYFMEHYPEWLQRVPLRFIASFLGMNLETLSRIRSKMASGKH